MSDDIIIRKANENDLEDVLKLIKMPSIDDGHIMELHDANAVYQSILDDSNYFQIIATTETEIVGVVTLVIIVQMTHEGSTTAFIDDLIVSDNISDKDEQLDIAKDLLEFAISLAQEYGCYKTVIDNDYLPELTESASQYFDFRKNKNSFLRIQD